MDMEKLRNLPRTNIGKMIGDINNLDWMDFERIEGDVCLGCNSIDERWFLIIKYQLELRKNIYLQNTECFFQAYKGNENVWTSNKNTVPFINTRFGITPYQANLIERITNGEIVVITPNHFPCENKYIGKRIATIETWIKKRSVEIIERNWLICRYEPGYTMCGNVLMHNIEEAREEYQRTMDSINSFRF